MCANGIIAVVEYKKAFPKGEKVPRYEADEDVLYLNNIVVLFSHQLPIFHNKSNIFFYIFISIRASSSVSSADTFSYLEKAFWIVIFDSADVVYVFICILIRQPAANPQKSFALSGNPDR